MHKSDYVYPLNDRFHLLSNAGGMRALTSNMCVCVCGDCSCDSVNELLVDLSTNSAQNCFLVGVFFIVAVLPLFCRLQSYNSAAA